MLNVTQYNQADRIRISRLTTEADQQYQMPLQLGSPARYQNFDDGYKINFVPSVTAKI